jgi:hypothetical protein
MTDALAALGVAALATSGVVAPAIAIALAVLFAIAIALPDAWRGRAAFARGSVILPLALAAALGIAVLAGGHSILAALAEALAGIAIARVATRYGAEQDSTLLVVSLVSFVAASVLGGGIACAVCIVGSCVVAPGALVLSLLRREVEGNYRQGARDRTGRPVDVARILRSRRVVGRRFVAASVLLGAPVVLVGGAIFIVLPRFDPVVRVSVGRIDLALSPPPPSNVIALRFEVDRGAKPEDRMALRLRGGVLDAYDGRRWTRSESAPAGTSAARLHSPGDGRDRRAVRDRSPRRRRAPRRGRRRALRRLRLPRSR